MAAMTVTTMAPPASTRVRGRRAHGEIYVCACVCLTKLVPSWWLAMAVGNDGARPSSLAQDSISRRRARGGLGGVFGSRLRFPGNCGAVLVVRCDPSTNNPS